MTLPPWLLLASGWIVVALGFLAILALLVTLVAETLWRVVRYTGFADVFIRFWAARMGAKRDRRAADARKLGFEMNDSDRNGTA